MTCKNKIKKNINACHGQSLIEVIVSMAIFSLIVVSITGLVLGGQALLVEGGRFTKADNIAAEGIEVVRAIFRNNWSKGVLNESAITNNAMEWDFVGEGTSEQIGRYTRTINFYPVYRNELNEIVLITAPNSYLDVQSKRVKVRVEWLARNNQNNFVEKETYLSNWSVSDFIQTDWSQGSGQSVWSNEQKYDSDDSNVIATSSISLREIATSTFASNGILTSSAFNIPDNSNFSVVEWDENIDSECSLCDIKVQLKFAPDVSGSPSVWTNEWVGPDGDDGDESDYFSFAKGELISSDFLEFSWVKYRVYLTSDTAKTPYLEELRIVYKK